MSVEQYSNEVSVVAVADEPSGFGRRPSWGFHPRIETADSVIAITAALP